jgi:hypothetical protein
VEILKAGGTAELDLAQTAMAGQNRSSFAAKVDADAAAPIPAASPRRLNGAKPNRGNPVVDRRRRGGVPMIAELTIEAG